MPFYSTTIFLTLILFSLRLLEIFFVYKHNMHRCALHVTILIPKHASMCSACNHFLQNKPFYSTTILVKLSEIFVYNQYMHRCALHVTTVYKHAFLQYYYFYINTIFITITRNIFRLQTQHASMCSACNHF